MTGIGMTDQIIINQIIILFLLVIVGGYARKTKMLNDTLTDGLSGILMNLALPALIVRSFIFEFSPADFKEISFDEYGSISIDHFLPWSFVLHDQIWNLTPTFQSINSAKNDRLPNLELHFEDFCQLQYTAYSFAQSKGKHKKLLEDYYQLDARLASLSKHNDKIEPEIFNRILKNAIVPLHQIAYNQGFNLWQWNN